MNFLDHEYQTKTIYPPRNDIFNAFKFTPYEDVKVVILGLDPYKNKNEAVGLSFSTTNLVKRPPSLENIFKERKRDLGIEIPTSNSLVPWAENGVFLLNTILTLEEGKTKSHQKKGWETFTDEVIHLINQKDSPVVFLLWGKDAQEKKSLITNPNHLILETSHPSPMGVYRGFDGCGHFSKANNFFIQNGLEPIDWNTEKILQKTK